jgi:hypothetical protein
MYGLSRSAITLAERPLRAKRWFVAASALVAGVLGVRVAEAQSTIRAPGARPQYTVELEPHLLLGPFDPPGLAEDDGIGAGLRATFEIVPDGFIGKVNDSVGIGVGADFVRYEAPDFRGRCTDFVDGPNGTRVCVEVDGSDEARNRLFVPVVMQWNFWLERHWSVFGEPGLFMYFGEDFGVRPFAVFLGGRYHFNESIALTLRIGYPTLSIGASFLF